jgi:beta-glucosidase
MEFLWGTATAAHQVEGGNFYNDWWLWEKQGHIRTGDSSHPACDHYHLFREDFQLIKFLKNNAYRFSVEWSRIEKEEGKFDEKEIEHYEEMLRELKRLEIEPVLTLHHFTIPIWLAEKGGAENPDFPHYFARFVKTIAPTFQKYVRYWITINEPVVLAVLGYLFGDWPPGIKSFSRMAKVGRNLLYAHRDAYLVIKECSSSALVSIAHNMQNFYPSSFWNPVDVVLARTVDRYYNFSFLETLIDGRIRRPFGGGERDPSLMGTLDYIGLNYYTRAFLHFGLKGFQEVKKKALRNDFGWEVYPQGIYEILIRLKPLGKEIMITESGTADRDDKIRPQYLREVLAHVQRAKEEGVKIIGYMHWSLMDNFEWLEGYSMRFGLFEVDFKTQERKPRRSAYVYQEISAG